MNEQLIKDHWWKAQIGYNEQNCDPEVLAKFAMSIVEECIKVFVKDLPEEGDGRMVEVVNRVCDVAEHFGVDK